MKKIYICPEMFSEEVSAACALLQESKSEGIDLSKSEEDGSNPSDDFGTKVTMATILGEASGNENVYV